MHFETLLLLLDVGMDSIFEAYDLMDSKMFGFLVLGIFKRIGENNGIFKEV